MVGFTKPTNKVVAAGKPNLVQELKVETATNMYPGRLVIKGTNEDDIDVATAASDVIGWLGYEQARDDEKPSDTDTAYGASDWAPVLGGGGFVLVAALNNTSGDATKGEKLVAGPSGTVITGSAATITVASGSTTVVSDKAQPDEDVEGAWGDEGIVIALAEEDVSSPGSGTSEIMVRSLI